MLCHMLRTPSVALLIAFAWTLTAAANDSKPAPPAPSLKVIVLAPAIPTSATASALKLETGGNVQGQEVLFTNLLPDTPYDLTIRLKDGTILQGVDMSWYNEEASKSPDKPLTEEDRKQIDSLAKDIKSFYDRTDYLHLIGDHDRAVALVQLVRDSDFHAGKGNIIWRIEVWFLKNQYGGWEKTLQQNKVLRRERYDNLAAFKEATGKLRFVPEFGGIRLTGADQPRVITLPGAAGSSRPSTTRPGP